MATFLAYVEPVPGRLHPLVTTLRELARRECIGSTPELARASRSNPARADLVEGGVP